MNYNYLTAIFRSILTQILCISGIIYIFINLALKSLKAKIVNRYFSTRNLYTFGENTFKYCSQIIVVHVHATVCFFLKFTKHVNILQNGIKPGSISKKTYKHAADCSKVVCSGVK